LVWKVKIVPDDRYIKKLKAVEKKIYGGYIPEEGNGCFKFLDKIIHCRYVPTH